MPIIGQTFPQLIDAHKASGPGQVIELLAADNPILDDAIARACNMGATERTMIRTGLPTATWGRLYQGVPQSKTTMQQVDDTTGFLEARSSIDTRLLKLAKDPAKQRLIDSAPFFETMNQEMATGLFYHDIATTPERFRGLGARYDAFYTGVKAGAPRRADVQVGDGGGRGSDNTSIWFVTWGDHATSLIYPEGTTAGVTMQDKGEEPVLDAAGNTYYAKVATYEWHMGVTVKDWRYNARVANIDVSDMLAGTVDLWALMRDAYYRLRSRRRDGLASRIAIYMNTDVMQVLEAQSTDRALTTARNNTVSLSSATVEGKEVKMYRGIPIRETDALLNTEAALPAMV
jgi:hypothetical protein